MTNYCPQCGSTSDKIETKEWDEEPVHLISIQLLCDKCGYGWNCVGTKKV